MGVVGRFTLGVFLSEGGEVALADEVADGEGEDGGADLVDSAKKGEGEPGGVQAGE